MIYTYSVLLWPLLVFSPIISSVLQTEEIRLVYKVQKLCKEEEEKYKEYIEEKKRVKSTKSTWRRSEGEKYRVHGGEKRGKVQRVNWGEKKREKSTKSTKRRKKRRK